jgi:hypothetical protein
MTGSIRPAEERRAAGTPTPGTRRLWPRATAWWSLSASAGVLGAEGAVSYVHPAAGVALVAADIGGPLIVALILLAAILVGSSQTCERVFRLLRWAANRPEPPAPPRSEQTPVNIPEHRQ